MATKTANRAERPEASDAYFPILYIVFIAHRLSPLSFLSFLNLNDPDRLANCPYKKNAFPARLRPNFPLAFRGPLSVPRQARKTTRAHVFRTRRSICPNSRRIRVIPFPDSDMFVPHR
jgi:hypothetical protein